MFVLSSDDVSPCELVERERRDTSAQIGGLFSLFLKI